MTVYEVVRHPSEYEGGTHQTVKVFDTLEEAREYIRGQLEEHWRDLREEYPSIESVLSHHLFAHTTAASHAVHHYYAGDDFAEVMQSLQWPGVSFDPEEDVVESYYADWMIGCGDYTIIRRG